MEKTIRTYCLSELSERAINRAFNEINRIFNISDRERVIEICQVYSLEFFRNGDLFKLEYEEPK